MAWWYLTLALSLSLVTGSSGCDDGGGERDGGGDGDADADLDADADGDEPDTGIDPTLDSDGDGLEDLWELDAGDEAILDRFDSDTDGDGIPDGAEDPDGDGLSNLEERALGRLSTSPPGPGPHPLRLDLLVELDRMAGIGISDAELAVVVAAYGAADIVSDAGVAGIGLQVYRDEAAITVHDLDGSFAQRIALLSAHGPTFSDDADPPIPYDMMIHVIVVTRRTDDPTRGGEVIADGSGEVANTGVLIYHDALAALHPACEVPSDPLQPAITLEDAMAATFTHELGHTLQLGHDTALGGGINYWNIMSVPTSCNQAHARFHGYANHDESLGATEAALAPRFSDAAADLMQLDNILSVHTSAMAGDGDGFEM